VTATFYVPGHTALAFPEAVRAILDAGHEIGHHGWVHENPAELDIAGEREVLEKGFAALKKVSGHVPTGYRSPGCDFSEATVALLREYGFLYDSSCSAADFTPYYLRNAYAHAPSGCYTVCMHPQVIGRGHRLAMLESFIEYMKDHEGVVFEPMLSYASRWKTTNPIERWRLENPARVGTDSYHTL
jgi:peptidoglycan/xylan/chitin deacetylase (PgdA/CDA1 family)